MSTLMNVRAAPATTGVLVRMALRASLAAARRATMTPHACLRSTSATVTPASMELAGMASMGMADWPGRYQLEAWGRHRLGEWVLL